MLKANIDINSNKDKVIVVGAGLAGLTAAVILAKNGIQTTLLETSDQIGGRARSITHKQQVFDNATHLFFSSQQSTLTLLHALGLNEENIFNRYPLRFWIESEQSGVDLTLGSLTFPLNFMMALMTAKGFSSKERANALKFYRTLTILDFELSEDISVEDLLIEYKQSQALMEHFWEPLVRLTLNTPSNMAKAQFFLTSLKNMIATKIKEPALLQPKTELESLFFNPLMQFLQTHHCNIQFNQTVKSIDMNKGIFQGVQTQKQCWQAGDCILAIPPHKTVELIQPQIQHYPELKALAEKLTQFQYLPRTTVYLEFNKPLILPYPMLGLAKQTGHWLFANSIGNPNRISINIFGEGTHLTMKPEALVAKLRQELKQKFPKLGEIKNFKILVEAKVAINCCLEIDSFRPELKTGIPGITLAGDYTQKGLPASHETSIQSGIKAAQLVLSKKAEFATSV